MGSYTLNIDFPATKDALRKYFMAQRNDLPPNQISDYSGKICQRVLSMLPEHKVNIHLFLPIEHLLEVNFSQLLPLLWSRGDRIYVPRVTHNILEHVEITPETEIEKNRWGIPEPSIKYPAICVEEVKKIDIVLTPLLVCDQQGYRVGYGGGFYDAFFKEYPHLQKVGVGFFEPITHIVDTYAGDIPLDQYISPDKITDFRS